MEYETSSRGFKYLPEFTCSYGSRIAVYESSAASQPCLWLKIQTDTENLPSVEKGEGIAHFTLEQAERLRDQLDWLIKNHYLVKES